MNKISVCTYISVCLFVPHCLKFWLKGLTKIRNRDFTEKFDGFVCVF